MAYRIKNWGEYQHYKTGRANPSWVKLYKKLLDDPEWFSLPPAAAKFLISAWLVASETNGILPASSVLAFRLRTDSKMIDKFLNDCNHWIINDASNVLAECYQDASPEQNRTEQNRDMSGKPDECVLVFDHWRQVMNHPNAKFDSKRKKLITARLGDGYSSADLIKAIDGCKKSPYHMGDNDSHTVYDGLDLILRDAQKVDSFMAKMNGHAPGNGNPLFAGAI